MPSTQFAHVGFELAKWDYVGVDGGEYLYRYSFNSRILGVVTCKPEA
ncbi:hypothetical protein VSH64_37335 [Amycolatopsis rhabdoformis]|uniref:Uncharacterized protein n=1 Tax=Amycolatopsis rhabdoformis TaxID=1448059 RepID=A0ABZ1I251_9PSEU|nr:hypothetical protein [Amycolatopsis rhabdoformis]WSE28454.1 hypothetical protein VSH64_37335 [Amycolatopsis rhabdoformis]